jgi:hypothetical protein
MKKKVEYTNNGRYGYVIYKEGESVLQCYYEFGGGNCVAIINVPSIDEWEKSTRLPLADRDRILRCIAEQVVKDQTLHGTYRLTDATIEILSGPEMNP